MSVVNRAFGWSYELIAFNPEVAKTAILNNSTKFSGDFTTVSRNAKYITELRMMADITSGKSSKNQSDSATISVYNCSEDTLSYLVKGNTVVLKAGYETQNSLPVLFLGTISKVTTEPSGADRLTRMTCQTVKFVKDNVSVALSIPPEAYTYRQVIEALLGLCSNNGVPTELVTNDGDITTEIIQGGFTFEGELLKELQRFCNSIQYKVIYSLGKIRVEPKKYTNSSQVVKITEDNILKGIQNTSDDTGVSASDSESTDGVLFTTFLNGGITVSGDLVNGVGLNLPLFVDIDGFRGVYDPKEIKHKLDSEGSDWHTQVKAVRR